MIEVISDSIQKATKPYNDDGWEFINEWISDGMRVEQGIPAVSFADKRLLVAHMQRGKPYIIEKGDIYQKQFNKMDGHVYTFRMNKELFDIASKYDVFPTDY